MYTSYVNISHLFHVSHVNILNFYIFHVRSIFIPFSIPSAVSEAIGDELISEIIAATERGPSNHDYGVGGHEAFTSIVFSPKARRTRAVYCSSSSISMFSIGKIKGGCTEI